MFNCNKCGNTFTTRSGEADLYCSKACGASRNHFRKAPTYCKECGVLFRRRDRGKFCTKSCAAIYNNARKTTKPGPKPGTRLKPVKIKVPMPLKYRTCANCLVVESTKTRFVKDVCKYCCPSLLYRTMCKFTFNLKDFPHEFDFNLLNQVGMFHPTKNKLGCSRDHKLSVTDGKRLRVDPKIMSHPANCQLMLQSTNKTKFTSSSITLEQLLELIRLWDIKYPKLVAIA